MINIYLSSSFKDTISLFEEFTESETKGKTVTFIPTAAIVEEYVDHIKSGKKALENLGFIVDELEISTAAPETIQEKLKHNDYIYAAGGNTFFLLQEMKRTGTDKIIIEEINLGKLYIGESAGSIILCPNIEYAKYLDDINRGPDLTDFDGLNVLDFYLVPHHTNFPFKSGVNKIISKYGSILNLCLISNTQAVSVKGNDKKVLG